MSVTIDTIFKNGGNVDIEVSESKQIPGADNNGPANVTVGFRRTENLGDYRSLSVEVSVNLPCRVEDVETTIESAKNIANEYLAEYVVAAVKASVTASNSTTGGTKRVVGGKTYVPKPKRVRADTPQPEAGDELDW